LSDRIIVDALRGIPRIQPGDDLIRMLGDALAGTESPLEDGDVLVVAQKVVSRAENRFFHLADVTPSARATELAQACDKDPRLVELILGESASVVRCEPGVLIVTHRLGHSMANAGIDRSNVAGDDDMVLLLPEDPDGWCAEARAGLEARFGVRLGVLMSDSFGRPWRLGTTGVAIGTSGTPALVDVRGRADLDGRILEVTQIGVGDEVAAAASLLMGQAAEGVPACVVRGLKEHGEGSASDLIRPPEADLFGSTKKP
jgi:coenzyme F420-0:L-glutamate ligase / coenzyme F420-1:gamma-L-glutamate ligase